MPFSSVVRIYQIFSYNIYVYFLVGGSTRDVVASVLPCDLIVSEFEFQSLHYLHFRTNISKKCMNYFILSPMG